MEQNELTLEQRIHNAQGSQELERKKAIHSYVHAVNYENEEFDRLWIKSGHSTWGHNFGRMVGWNMIYYNHILGEMKKRRKTISVSARHTRICALPTSAPAAPAICIHCQRAALRSPRTAAAPAAGSSPPEP